MRSSARIRAVLLVALLGGCADPKEDVPGSSADAGVSSTSSTSTSSIAMAFQIGTGRIHLPVDATRLGVTRGVPVVVRQGPSAEDPTVAVLPGGRVLVALVGRQGPREHIELARAPNATAPLTPPRPITRGDRAWHPRLAIGADGAAWMVWCGRDRPVARGDHRKNVYLMYVAPGAPGAPILVSPRRSSQRDQRRHCDPELTIGADGVLHVVWEASQTTSPLSSRIAYRRFSPGGEPLGPMEMVSPGPFDRRPAVAATSSTVHVAWDALAESTPTGHIDPDYDVLMATRTSTAWGEPLVVDRSEGIQAAPALAATKEGVLIAYHSSERHGLVKWWTLRRYRNGRLERLSAADPAGAILPQGQQQGAEMPAIAVDATGRVLVATRTSHGAYLHVVDARGVSPAFDLTRRGWGARGLRMDMTIAKDGSLLVVRRARHDVIMERFQLSGPGGPPEFEPLEVPSSEKRRRKPRFRPIPVRSKLSEAFAHATIYFGDVHMHSAVSDGTGPPDEIYARAKSRGYQFAALTDHDYVAGARMMLSEHDEITWLTDVFDAGDGFTALHAFEWTGLPVPRGAGHKNVYFRADPPSPLYESKNGHGTTRLLQKALSRENAFTAPHHTGWSGTDWHEADPNIQRHLEIVSVHGAFEDPVHQPLPTRAAQKGMFAVDGLRLGKRFGFLGGSDAHGVLWHHGVGRRMDPWSHGLTGVIAARHERGAIWDALYARRTFATSGAPMWILTAIAGAPQGEEVAVEWPPRISWEAEGTKQLEELVVVRDGTQVHRVEPTSSRHRGSFVDEDAKPGWHSYYVRAHQGTGIQGTDAVWSSPIFVQVKEKP